MGDRITVLNPMGFAPKVTRKALAPRLDTLDGKTVYLVDCRFDDSDVFLKQMQAWFGEHMPGVRTVFKPISSVYLKDDPTTWEEIKARGHAAIVGVGHILTVHSSPDQITVIMSADFEDSITAGEVERIIARIEARVEAHWPIVKRLYIRPQQDAVQIGAEIKAQQG